MSATSVLPRIGFIGLGLMGSAMAHNILAKGYPLAVLAHRNRARIDELMRLGATEAGSPRELAQRSQIVFICVTGSPQVEALVRGPQGIAAGAHAGLICVDCSTSDPNSTIALAKELAPLGASFCDAPLGGTPAQAAEGRLAAMVGCDAEVWPRLEQAIGAWAGKAQRVGPVGDGHKTKLLMNFLSLGYAALYAELLAVAGKIGISAQAVADSVRGSRMDCGVFQTFFRWVLERDREAHKFTLSNAHKDLRYLAAVASTAGVANPLGSAVKNYYALAEAGGRGGDFVPMLADIVASMHEVAR